MSSSFPYFLSIGSNYFFVSIELLTKCLQAGDKLELFNVLPNSSLTVVPFNMLIPGLVQLSLNKQTNKKQRETLRADGSKYRHHGLPERDVV
jgi:hypothetical protein